MSWSCELSVRRGSMRRATTRNSAFGGRHRDRTIRVETRSGNGDGEMMHR